MEKAYSVNYAMDCGFIPKNSRGSLAKTRLKGYRSISAVGLETEGLDPFRGTSGGPAGFLDSGAVVRHYRRREAHRRPRLSTFRAPKHETKPWARGGEKGELTPRFGSAWEEAKGALHRENEAGRGEIQPSFTGASRAGFFCDLDANGAVALEGELYRA